MIGISPTEIDKQEYWPLMAAVSGYAVGNGAKVVRPDVDISDDTLAEMGIVGF